jgi:hypothetical protein
MTPEQRALARDLMITPPTGERRISKELFLSAFPYAVEQGSLSGNLLELAEQDRSAEDLQCALIVGHAFGFTSDHKDILCRLIDDEWHYCHEDIVSALEAIQTGDRDTVNALYQASVFVPHYLEYDESRALAIKAIWALGRIASEAANEKLLSLTQSSDPKLRECALTQLKRQQDR